MSEQGLCMYTKAHLLLYNYTKYFTSHNYHNYIRMYFLLTCTNCKCIVIFRVEKVQQRKCVYHSYTTIQKLFSHTVYHFLILINIQIGLSHMLRKIFHIFSCVLCNIQHEVGVDIAECYICLETLIKCCTFCTNKFLVF